MKLLLRIAAILLVSLALVPRGATEHDRLLVIALDGAQRSEIERLASQGRLEHLSGVIRGAIASDVFGGSSRDRRGFWHAIFSGRAWPNPPSVYVWGVAMEQGLSAAVVGVPGMSGAVNERLVVLPGANEADGFVGDNVGRVASLVAIERGRIDWPYTAARKEIAGVIANLEVGAASAWIGLAMPAPDGRNGAFKIYRLDEDSVYLTPAYRNTRETEIGSSPTLYVADDPAWTAGTSRLAEYYYRHVRDLTADRAAVARELASGSWKLVVYVDTLLSSVRRADRIVDAAHAGYGALPSDALLEAYGQVDERIGALIDAAGTGAMVALIGSEPDDSLRRARSEGRPVPTGFLYLGGRSRSRHSVTYTTTAIAQVAPTLLYLLDVAPVGEAEPMATVVARYPRTRVAKDGRGSGKRASSNGIPMTVESLRELGLLSEKAAVPAPISEAQRGDADAVSSAREESGRP